MNEKILDRLKKLIRHQQSAAKMGSVHEAELFADKIQDELDKYNLSLSEIDISEKGINIEKEYRDIDFKRKWKQILIHAIAQTNSCHAIVDSPRMIIVGTKEDREIVYELYSYFSELGEHLSYLEGQAYKRKYGCMPSKFKGSFMLGYGQTLASRLRNRHYEAMKRAPQTSTAMVYIGDKLAKTAQYVNDFIPTKKMRMNTSVGNWDSYERGESAAKSINLSDKTVEGGKVKQIP